VGLPVLPYTRGVGLKEGTAKEALGSGVQWQFPSLDRLDLELPVLSDAGNLGRVCVEEEGWVVQLYGACLVAAVFPPAPARELFWRAGAGADVRLRIEAAKSDASTLTLVQSLDR